MNKAKLFQILESRTLKVWMLFLIALLFAYPLGKFAWTTFLKCQIGRQNYQMAKEFYEKPVSLSEDQVAPLSYPPEVIQMLSSIKSQRQRLSEFIESQDMKPFRDFGRMVLHIQEQHNELLEEELGAWEPLIDEVRALVEMPGYDLGAGDYSKGDRAENWESISLITDLLLLQMKLEWHQGRYDEAFETMHVALEFLRHPAEIDSLSRSVALSETDRIIIHGQRLISESEDPELLGKHLEKLLELKSSLFPPWPEDLLFSDILWNLRLFAGQDNSVTIPTEGNQGDYSELWRTCRYENIPITYSAANRFTQFLCVVFGTQFVKCDYYFWQSRKDFRTVFLCTECDYDLLCLLITQRIQDLKSETTSETSRPQRSSFFVKELIDPFSEEPFLWDATRETFYSVGPDETDDRMTITYDPTNGTVSEGDIFLGVCAE